MSQDSSFFYWFFSSGSLFFADSRRKNGFQPVKSAYFCAGQQKKRTARKEPVKRTAILGHVNRLIIDHLKYKKLVRSEKKKKKQHAPLTI